MELLFQIVLLVVGLALLWKVGEKTVQDAVGFSVAFGIERFTIGFFIFAISTGLPEISSAVVSSIRGVPELSSGDLLGSSFVNMSLILGISILVAKEMEIHADLRKKLFATIGLLALLFIGIAINPIENLFTGILLVLIYIGSFFWFQVGMPKKEVEKEVREVEKKMVAEEKKWGMSPKAIISLRLLRSLIFLILSSWLTVHAAANVAELLDLELNIVGATFVAVGTSLPELALEIHAVRRKEYALAVGDIFGSSLLNISFILGILVFMNPNLELRLSKVILPFALAVIGWMAIRLFQKKPLVKKDGLLFIGAFVVYMIAMYII